MKLPHFHHGKHERGKMPPPADDEELQAPVGLDEQEKQEGREQQAGGTYATNSPPPSADDEQAKADPHDEQNVQDERDLQDEQLASPSHPSR